MSTAIAMLYFLVAVGFYAALKRIEKLEEAERQRKTREAKTRNILNR